MPSAKASADAMDDNPYESPSAEERICPVVEVVLRHRWGRRAREQVYRFASGIEDQDLLRERVVSFYERHKAYLRPSDDAGIALERAGTSVLFEFFGGSEKRIPHTITVSLQRIPHGTLVICHYRIRFVVPPLIIPPHPLEKEVRELAAECGGKFG